MAASAVMVVRPSASGSLRHGGTRRSQQIDELLASAGVPAAVCTMDRATCFDPRGLSSIAAVGPRAWTWSNLLDATARSRSLRAALPGHRSALVEVPQNPIIERITAGRCRVRIAVPQNIESFNEQWVRNWRTRDRGAGVANEVRVLGRYDAVFTIAIEEYWLLANAGCEAHFLPYTPPRDVLDWLNALREVREGGPPHEGGEVVVFGTIQPRHVEATVRLVKVLHAAGLRPVVVGYGTETLAAQLRPWADLRGAIPTEALFTLLVRCRAVAVFQTGGGGALTRIVELGHAGVPVVAAGVAGRSMHGWQHLTWVDEVSEIPAVLPAPGTTIAAVDPWDSVRQGAERRMLAWLIG
jgi:hypothetical protein